MVLGISAGPYVVADKTLHVTRLEQHRGGAILGYEQTAQFEGEFSSQYW